MDIKKPRGHKMDFVWTEGYMVSVFISVVFYISFGVMAGFMEHPLWFLTGLAPLIMGAGGWGLHDGHELERDQRNIWDNYKHLPPDLKARVPLDKDWLRYKFPKMDYSDQQELAKAISNLASTHANRMAEEAKQLIPFKHMVEAAHEAADEEKARTEDLIKINRDMKELM